MYKAALGATKKACEPNRGLFFLFAHGVLNKSFTTL